MLAATDPQSLSHQTQGHVFGGELQHTRLSGRDKSLSMSLGILHAPPTFHCFSPFISSLQTCGDSILNTYTSWRQHLQSQTFSQNTVGPCFDWFSLLSTKWAVRNQRARSDTDSKVWMIFPTLSS